MIRSYGVRLLKVWNSVNLMRVIAPFNPNDSILSFFTKCLRGINVLQRNGVEL